MRLFCFSCLFYLQSYDVVDTLLLVFR